MLRRLVLPAVLIGLTSLPAAAQWPPDSLVNLQVLPKDTPVREIRTMMRGFAGALGVRCIYCHVGDDPDDLASTDFPSDEKIQKRKAREMIRMVQRINGDLLAGVPERSTPPIEVTCTTCHHGVTRPMDIRDLLTATVLAYGADSAIAEYRALKERYYGSASYDFRPFMLANVADRLAESRPDAAIALAEYNLGEHPKEQQSYFAITRILVARGDTAGAIRTLQRGLEQLPGHRFLEQTLQRLRGR